MFLFYRTEVRSILIVIWKYDIVLYFLEFKESKQTFYPSCTVFGYNVFQRWHKRIWRLGEGMTQEFFYDIFIHGLKMSHIITIFYHYHFHYPHQSLCTAVNLWSFSELITTRRREARQWQRQGLNNLHSLPSPWPNIANLDQTLPSSISNIANHWPNSANLRPNIANLRPKLPVLGSWLPLLHTHLSMQKIKILKRSDSEFQDADGHIFFTFKFAMWCQKFDWSWYRAFVARPNLDLPKMYLCRKRGPVWVVLVYLFTCVLVPSLRCTCVGGGPSLSWWAKEVVGCLLLLGPRTHVEPSSTSPFKDFPFILFRTSWSSSRPSPRTSDLFGFL